MRKRLTPSMVISLIALFVALSGTAVAGTGLITGAQIKDHSIGYNDLNAVTVNRLKGARGPAGPSGPAGEPGPAGAAGVAGGFNPAKVSYVTSAVTALGSAAVGTASVECPAGTRVIGGGAATSGDKLWASSMTGNGWYAGAIGYGFGIGGNLTAYAICAAP